MSVYFPRFDAQQLYPLFLLYTSVVILYITLCFIIEFLPLSIAHEPENTRNASVYFTCTICRNFLTVENVPLLWTSSCSLQEIQRVYHRPTQLPLPLTALSSFSLLQEPRKWISTIPGGSWLLDQEVNEQCPSSISNS